MARYCAMRFMMGLLSIRLFINTNCIRAGAQSPSPVKSTNLVSSQNLFSDAAPENGLCLRIGENGTGMFFDQEYSYFLLLPDCLVAILTNQE